MRRSRLPARWRSGRAIGCMSGPTARAYTFCAPILLWSSNSRSIASRLNTSKAPAATATMPRTMSPSMLSCSRRWPTDGRSARNGRGKARCCARPVRGGDGDRARGRPRRGWRDRRLAAHCLEQRPWGAAGPCGHAGAARGHRTFKSISAHHFDQPTAGQWQRGADRNSIPPYDFPAWQIEWLPPDDHASPYFRAADAGRAGQCIQPWKSFMDGNRRRTGGRSGRVPAPSSLRLAGQGCDSGCHRPRELEAGQATGSSGPGSASRDTRAPAPIVPSSPMSKSPRISMSTV